MTERADIAVIGLGVMGRNLALNMADHGHSVAVSDLWEEARDSFRRSPEARGGNPALAEDLPALVAALKAPRAILLMVKAGETVDEHIERLLPLLSPGDLIIDGGNSHYRDTIRRSHALKEKGVDFLGVGVSGGEEGARHGPALMIGGNARAYRRVEPILSSIAARAHGRPCRAYMGDDGAGHFVKMLHNGIEYADMQLIAEAYQAMKDLGGLDHGEISAAFARWNEGELASYLVEITADILTRRDADTGQPLVELILDSAGQKGTGLWSSQAALELGVPAPTIIEAVQARAISSLKDQRLAAQARLPSPTTTPLDEDARAAFIDRLGAALLTAKICAYAQGFAVIQGAAAEYGWDVKPAELALAWRGGCIIRARLLDRINLAYRGAGDGATPPENLLVADCFRPLLEEGHLALREIVAQAALAGVPVPALSSALAYYDAYRSGRLWANLIQAQRDYFGAHTYQRLDRAGSFHTDWSGKEG